MVNKKEPQELETFLPVKDKTGGAIIYKIQSKQQGIDATEKGSLPSDISSSYDFLKERKIEHPTTDNETLTHLLKASLGTGILSMPIAFMYSGLILGVFSTILTSLICTHCSYILVKVAHKLYNKVRRSQMSFADVAEVAFINGPKWGRKFAGLARFLILFCLFLSYFGTCSVYTVIVAKNFEQVIEYFFETDVSIRFLIALLLVPLILLSYVPNLKYLAPISMVANGFMGTGLGITFYYLVTGDRPAFEKLDMVNFSTLPAFFAIAIFAMEAIGVVMPLENNMKTPQNFIGICGVLSRGMSGVTVIYMLLGFLGYLKYGVQTGEAITLNLPSEEIPAQIVKVFIGLAVFCTYGLQFYVCLEICWDSVKDKCTKRPMIVNYVIRTVLVTASVVLAIAVPSIAPFMGLIGAFCFSILGLLLPVAIEIVTYWDDGFGPYNWIILKNIFITIFGFTALIFGSLSAIQDIMKLYTDQPIETENT